MTELISIIIPVYKVSAYLDQCISSIVNQTYKNLEIILVDDGSPDECPEMCDNWATKDSRIKVIHKANGGLSDARNAGMDIATGEIIAFVDSDDYAEPEYIEYLHHALEKTGADIAQCKFHKFADSAKEESYNPNKTTETVVYSREEVLRWFSNPAETHNHFVWDKLYRRSVLKNERFAVGFQAQDILFSCHVFCNCNAVALVNCELFHYRMRPGSASNVFSKQRADAFEMYYQSYEYLRDSYPQFAVDAKARCCSLCIGAVDWALHVADKENGQKLLEETYKFRKRINFTFREWMSCSFPNKIRIIFSHERIIIPAMKIRYLVRLATGG